MEKELVTSLTSFLGLYSRHRDRLQSSFVLTAAQLHDYESENMALESQLVLYGGIIGATCGAVLGGVSGALGGVGAAIYRDVGVSFFGLFGSVFGGVVGGSLGGTVGGAVCAAGEAKRRPVNGDLSDVAWLTIGFAAGGAVGGTFGGAVGAAGGGMGGALGAFYATKCSASFVGFLVGCCQDQEIKSKKVNMMQETAEFREAVTPLMEELTTIQATCDKMESGGVVHGVARGAAEALAAALSRMEETIGDSERAEDLPQFVSSAGKTVRQSKEVTEELETTRAEVERLLEALK